MDLILFHLKPLECSSAQMDLDLLAFVRATYSDLADVEADE